MVNSNGTIKHKATIAGQNYRVIETKKGTGNVWGAIDRIKNETTGDIKEMRRKEWFELFNKFE